MVERTRIGRGKNLNFAIIDRTDWNEIPMNGESSNFYPNREQMEHRHCAIAKQSSATKKELDCFVARAARDDLEKVRYKFAFSRRDATEV
jgi:hypothetical protein